MPRKAQLKQMTSFLPSRIVLGLMAAPLFLAACGTSIAESCQARGLETGTPEYRACLDEERADERRRLGRFGGGPPGSGR